jgi:hypothetical protein
MDEELISKKDLLEQAKISYGQLYRWKRKNLIPEEWFIRKSTFTGQETFFPKQKILARIAKILDMKEDLSLTDLADVFSPSMNEISITKEALLERGIATKPVIDFFTEMSGGDGALSFKKILYVYVLEKMFQSGGINFDEGKMVLQVMADNYPRFEGRKCELVFFRKLGTSSCFLSSGSEDLYFEGGVKITARIDISTCIEELKIKL